jgi:hypothetical protein
MSWIQTVNNKKIDFKDPDPDQIIIEDIASGLSNMPRFAGQLRKFYSVAEHCLLAERLYVQATEHPDVDVCRAILMHDATEAYMCDVPTPLKSLLKEYQLIEDMLDEVIKEKFSISTDEKVQEIVKKYDVLMLKNEAVHEHGDLNWLNEKKYRDVPIIKNFTIYHMAPPLARGLFIQRWKELI